MRTVKWLSVSAGEFAVVLLASIASASDARLIDAVKHQDLKAVQTLLKQGVDVTVQATFDGRRYQSREIAVNSVSAK